MYEKSLKYLNMGFTGMFSVETILKIIGFGVKVGAQQQFDEWGEKAHWTDPLDLHSPGSWAFLVLSNERLAIAESAATVFRVSY